VQQAVRIGFGVLTPMLIVCAVFAPRFRERKPLRIAVFFATSTSPSPVARTDAEPLDTANQQDEKHDGSAIDLYGNDVSDAVAKYKLDATGSLYELHSPQTELPRLGSPKS
jgi:hypothetical protein